MDGYEAVAACMNPGLRETLRRIPPEIRRGIREIRLRQGQPVALTTAEGIRFLLPEGRLTEFDTPRALRVLPEEIDEIFRRACGYSVHSWEEEAVQGFLTLEGGHRVGVAGTASLEKGRVRALRQVGSLNFRIARSIPGAAGDLPSRFYRSGHPPSVLVAGEPGSGKTTLLKDLVRRLSSGETGRYFRIAVVDQRSELAGGDLGPCTDLLRGYPKGEGMSAALRSLSPDLLVCDEIGGEEEAAAVAECLNAGVALLCTVHAGSFLQLKRRRPLRILLETGAFDWAVVLGSRERTCQIRGFWNLREGESGCEMAGGTAFVGGQRIDRIPAGVEVG